MDPGFRFERFADSASALAAFNAAYPPGSPIQPALQALVDIGAQCKAVSQTRVACRYVEKSGLVTWSWQLALECDAERAIRRAVMSLAAVGP